MFTCKIVQHLIFISALLPITNTTAQELKPVPPVLKIPAPAVTSNCESPASRYRNLDFLIGEWEFFTLQNKKIADQKYTVRGGGCLILEDWTTLSGETGTGMNFIDPVTGNWRQVWMSRNFHLDYSGVLIKSGVLVLEGRMYPNNSEPAGYIKGIYTLNKDGSITKQFLRRFQPLENWTSFFIGIARRK